MAGNGEVKQKSGDFVFFCFLAGCEASQWGGDAAQLPVVLSGQNRLVGAGRAVRPENEIRRGGEGRDEEGRTWQRIEAKRFVNTGEADP
jgi:hypothetical protein